jgi:hypothetical protein
VCRELQAPEDGTDRLREREQDKGTLRKKQEEELQNQAARQLGLVVEDLVEHIRRIADRRVKPSVRIALAVAADNARSSGPAIRVRMAASW